MKRCVILVSTALAALAATSLANAKEISKVELCGAEECRELTGAAAQRLVGGDDMSRPPASPGPYYRVTLTAKGDGHNETWSIFYVPSAHRLALPDGNWQQVSGTIRSAYERSTAGLKPHPTPVLERVLIGEKAVEDPSSYLRLFEARSDRPFSPTTADWVPIELRFRGETPWSSPRPYLFYSPAEGLLQRGTDMVRLPDGMAASIRARESLASSDGSPWMPAVAIGLALVLAAAGTVWLSLRRERRSGMRRPPVPTA